MCLWDFLVLEKLFCLIDCLGDCFLMYMIVLVKYL